MEGPCSKRTNASDSISKIIYEVDNGATIWSSLLGITNTRAVFLEGSWNTSN